MASSLYKAQFALRFCENHDKKELIAYCKTCQEKICSSCIKEEHSNHDWETITDILREKKHSLPEECKEIRAKQLPGLRRELSKFERKIEEEDAHFIQNKSTLNGSRESYISEINRLFDYRINECRQNSESAKQIYKNKREGLRKKVEYLETMTTAVDKDISTLPDYDILDMEKEMRNELKKALSYNADKYTCTTVFVPRQMDVQALENMIGEIHTATLDEKNDIDTSSNFILSVKAVSENNAWVRIEKDNFAKLIDTSGNVLKTLQTSSTDLLIPNSKTLVLTSKQTCSISVLTENEDRIRTIETKPLFPTYMSKTENGDILVILRDNGDDYNLVPTSRRIVQRMTIKGEVLHTFEFREDGKTRLFTLPHRTAENKNTDLYVINMLSNGTGEMVAFHNDGRVKFTYRGGGLKSEKFDPVDVECDSKCRILLTEWQSGTICMLNAEGMYLCTLLKDKQLYPFVISFHGDNLWCGFGRGRVKVLKYISN